MSMMPRESCPEGGIILRQAFKHFHLFRTLRYSVECRYTVSKYARVTPWVIGFALLAKSLQGVGPLEVDLKCDTVR